jgi:hypothetical protein
MTPAFVLALSLAVSTAIDTQTLERWGTPGADSTVHMSAGQKNAAVQPLVRSATECVARNVSASPRFSRGSKPNEINDLIVDTMQSCIDAMRTMMDAYDRYYGVGAGEAFFSGPYLDVLPTAVHRLLDHDSPK